MINYKELYNQLMTLCSESETFYFKDTELHGCIYRVFSYRLASFSEFLKPGALECRGHMFEIDENGNVIRLACLPPEKFFNDGENPFTMDLDYSNPEQIMAKMDGSLISSYMHYPNGGWVTPILRLKSKTALNSVMAVDAMAWLKEHPMLEEVLYAVASGGATVNMEWVSPDNRIVIGYPEPKLIILNIRVNSTGEYVDADYFKPQIATTLKEHWVEHIDVNDVHHFVRNIVNMTGIEGFVVKLNSNNPVKFVKLKTEAYQVLHRTKDSINSPRQLFEAVVNETADDLRSLFATDPVALTQIADMEAKVVPAYNHLVATVEAFYAKNRELARKEYAILGQSELGDHFSLGMNLYLGKEVDYKAFMIKNYEKYGPSISVKKLTSVFSDDE